MSRTLDQGRVLCVGDGVTTDVKGAADQPAFPQIQNALYFGGLSQTLGAPTRLALSQAASPQDWNTLFLSSPEFMRR